MKTNCRFFRKYIYILMIFLVVLSIYALGRYSIDSTVKEKEDILEFIKIARGDGPSLLKVQMTDADRHIVFDLLKAIDLVAKRLNISYFMWAGTLLGSYRNHDIIPWDDDIDLIFNFEDRFLLMEYLPKIKEILPETLIERANMRIKVSDKRGVRYYTDDQDFAYRWPFIDIEFFQENATHIFTINDENTRVFDRSDIFPGHHRPLGNLWLSSPRNPVKVLKAYYDDLSVCSTGRYSHKLERFMRLVGDKAKCKSLLNVYPFVKRRLRKTSSRQQVEESLIERDKLIHTVYVDETEYEQVI
ncbi:DgyrCDS13310 [Dimorphilus gyrociliatus]|uniref:DgyrCDS13310 n=1 Tax=Dimorphilus gyrociliatus TaxID=2664684 RepID=A0A7I8WAC0_9ANNE|nr:DgyrCDS13310 [Dimorphilus gyrociliatus]